MFTDDQIVEWAERNDLLDIGMTDLRCAVEDAASLQEAAGEVSNSTPLLVAMLEKWQQQSKKYDETLQVGRCGSDDYSYAHGKWDMLDDCIEELIIAMGN